MILIFLVAVAVCGVFFSLGFLVGFNERASRATPVTERVEPPSEAPPPINAPPGASRERAKQSAAPAAAPGVLESDLAKPGKATTPARPAERPAAGSGSQPSSASAGQGAAPASVADSFTVQVAATRTKADAEELVKVLKGRGYPVFLVSPEYAHANDNLYRVQVGPYPTRDAADKIKAKLSQEGFKPFIRH
jgi:DedD protein